MLNAERWKGELLNMAEQNIKPALVNGRLTECFRCECRDCDFFRHETCTTVMMKWLLSEYEEPKVDWTKVKVDTPILVSHDNIDWYKRHFCKIDEDGEVYAWSDGSTSWTTVGYMQWEYAKLEDGDE